MLTFAIQYKNTRLKKPKIKCQELTQELCQKTQGLPNILCWVVFDSIKIFCLPYMKSTSDEEAEKLLEAISRRISIFVLVESAGRDENKNRDESKSFQKLFNFRIH